MPGLVKDLWVRRCTPRFFFVLRNRLLVSAEAGIGEAQMIVAKRRVGIRSQCCLKLFDSLQSAVGILISASQENMGQGMRRMELHRLFQRRCRRRILALS